MNFEQIKDANQLQQYLQKHAASGGMTFKSKDASPAANDYMGRQQKLKQTAATGGVGQNAGAAAVDRYEKGLARA